MLYIHIPFCRQICSYCDFHHSASLVRRDDMIEAIKAEIVNRRALVPSVRTLYFGGGTPSVCTPDQIGSLINLVRDLWQTGHFEELTLEANPEDLTPSYLSAIRAAGVDRLSIGIQSFDDDHLRRMNRSHTATQAVRAVASAQAAGFDNITIDLIYGLPWMTERQWRSNVEQAIALGVQHISAYHLTIEPRTIFGKRGLQPVDDAVSESHFSILRQMLIGAGFEHYEVSNFALNGRRAIHNSGYWRGEAYLGVGPSAHSYDGMRRRYHNVSSNRIYLDGRESLLCEELRDEDLHNEYVMTRLRTADGFSIKEYENRFDRKPEVVPGLIVENGIARIKPEDFLMSDSIICSLFI